MSNKRLLHLDVLRGIAILLVLGRHYSVKDAAAFTSIQHQWMAAGWLGVDLFFVLSGFLIGSLLFREIHQRGTLDTRRFLIRRGFKIWPAYYVYLAYVFVMLRITEADVPLLRTIKQMVPNLVHLQNYLGSRRGQTWSLSVEEHFYALLPLLLVFLASRTQWRRSQNPVQRAEDNLLRFFPWVAMGVALGCLAMRLFTNFGVHLSQHTLEGTFKWTHLRIDSLFFGVLLAYIQFFKPQIWEGLRKRRAALIVAGAVLLLPVLLDGRAEESVLVRTIGCTLSYLGFGGILLGAVLTPEGEGALGFILGNPLSRILAFIGFYSYSIYLWHIEVARFMAPQFEKIINHNLPSSIAWPIIMLAYVVMCTALGTIMAAIVERPALAIRDRLFPAPKKTHLTEPLEPEPITVIPAPVAETASA